MIDDRRRASLVIAGVSASGKTTVAREFARRFGRVYLEGDELHSAREIHKMASGHALDDGDRVPWLERVGARIRDEEAEGHAVVTACSALKRSYRDLLRRYAPDSFFAMLEGPIEVVRARMEARSDHFMPPSLLDSQYATLEPLQADEAGVSIDLTLRLEDIVTTIADALDRSTP